MNTNLTETLGPDFSNKIKSSRNLSIEIVLFIIVSILFFWFIVLPKKAVVQTQQDNLDTLQAQESKMANALSQLNKMVSDLNSHRNDVADLDYALPLGERVNSLQQLIQTLADSVNVSVVNIQVADKTDVVVAGDKNLLKDQFGATRTLQVLSGSVSVVGTFSQLEAFLQKIENSGRIMDINSLGIDSGSNGNLSLKITLNSYYLAPY